jgi:membrane protease YdiL (CAAX protease family)
VYEPAQDDPTNLVPRPMLPVQRLGAAVEVGLCSGIPSQVVIITVMQGFGMKLQTGDGHLSPPFIFALSLIDAMLVVGLVALFLRSHHESIRDVLFGKRHLFTEAVLGLALLPAIFMFVVLVVFVILFVAPQLHNVARNPLEDMLRTRGDAMIFAVVVTFAGGVREEVQRGFILHRFGGYLGGVWSGLAMYSVLFGLGHFEQGYDAMIATGLLGAVWGVVYIVRRSIVAPVVSHAGFDLAQLLKYFVFVG